MSSATGWPVSASPRKCRPPGGCRRLADDAEVLTEAPVEVLPERAGDPRIVIDHEDDWP